MWDFRGFPLYLGKAQSDFSRASFFITAIFKKLLKYEDMKYSCLQNRLPPLERCWKFASRGSDTDPLTSALPKIVKSQKTVLVIAGANLRNFSVNCNVIMVLNKHHVRGGALAFLQYAIMRHRVGGCLWGANFHNHNRGSQILPSRNRKPNKIAALLL